MTRLGKCPNVKSTGVPIKLGEVPILKSFQQMNPSKTSQDASPEFHCICIYV
jgi:hypothetical protein